MSKISFLGRKSNAAPQPQPAADSDKIELENELFGPTAAQLGESNEAVRNLLANAGHRMNELAAIRESFGKLVEPVHKALSEFEAEKNEKIKLQALFNNARAAYAKLRTEYAAVEEKAASLESYYTRVRDELAIAQQ